MERIMYKLDNFRCDFQGFHTEKEAFTDLGSDVKELWSI